MSGKQQYRTGRTTLLSALVTGGMQEIQQLLQEEQCPQKRASSEGSLQRRLEDLGFIACYNHEFRESIILEVGEGYERGQNVQNILGISSWG